MTHHSTGYSIGSTPSRLAIDENAQTMACYASIRQAYGLFPSWRTSPLKSLLLWRRKSLLGATWLYRTTTSWLKGISCADSPFCCSSTLNFELPLCWSQTWYARALTPRYTPLVKILLSPLSAWCNTPFLLLCIHSDSMSWERLIVGPQLLRLHSWNVKRPTVSQDKASTLVALVVQPQLDISEESIARRTTDLRTSRTFLLWVQGITITTT